MKLPSIDDLEVQGKRVLLRVDFNVPMKDGEVTDDTRIRAALPTIRALQDRRSRVICCSHLGRPGGKPDPNLSLLPVGRALADVLRSPVRVTDQPNGPPEDLADLGGGDIALLENLRFHPGEESNDSSFAEELAALADVYVCDAFGAVHRAHASVDRVSRLLPRAAGLLLQKEVEVLSRLLENPKTPYVVVLGGAKVSDKLGVVKNLLDRANSILIGGAMANTFLKARGASLGASKVEEDRLDEVASTLEAAEQAGVDIVLPNDLVVGDRFDETAEASVVPVEDVPEGSMALDIGPESRQRYIERIKQASTILWNGPMGVFEWEAFSGGTKEVAEAVATAKGFTVVGGGDSVAALTQFGLTRGVDHLSTGGGASLEFLEGKALPGLVALTQEQQ